MLRLPDVTLCCVDGKNHSLALRALEQSRRAIEFARTVFVTDVIPSGITIPSDIDVIRIGPIRSHGQYSHIVMKGLSTYIETSHVLVVQWDGYVAHPEAWEDQFLQCDYIGAPWADGSVGNGGFSLRSRRLLQLLKDDRFPLINVSEDVSICGTHKPRLQKEFGIVFAEAELARRFSFESEVSYVLEGATPFGFHGIFHIFLVTDPAELLLLVRTFPESVARSETTKLLLRKLVRFRHYDAALALGQRLLEFEPASALAHEAIMQARDLLAVRDTTQKPRYGVIQRIAKSIRGR